jgi:sRNA-binding regulator protein Hfq
MSERVERSQLRRARKPKPDQAVKAKAEQLVGSGMPYQMAMAVAHGRMELNEALERMARKDRVNALMERHQLSRALATQIALGHASLEQVLSRRRLDSHRTDNRDRSALLPETRLTLALHDGRTLKGKVVAVEPYQVQFEADGGAVETLHKLKLLYTYAPDDWKAVKKGIRSDKKAGEPEAPAPRPQDRYSCSDRRLFGYLDRDVELNVTLLDGEILRGHLQWFGRYEFGFKLRSDAVVTVFRHALRDVSPAT